MADRLIKLKVYSHPRKVWVLCMYVCVLDVYEGCVCTYVCEWCMCAPTRVSKKISADRCLDQRLQRITRQHPRYVSVCACKFTGVWGKGWEKMTYQSSQRNFAGGMDVNHNKGLKNMINFQLKNNPGK